MRERVGAWGAELSDDDFACAIAARGVTPEQDGRVLWTGLGDDLGLDARRWADRWDARVMATSGLRCTITVPDVEVWPWLSRAAVGLAGLEIAMPRTRRVAEPGAVWPWRVADTTDRTQPLRLSPWLQRTLVLVPPAETSPPAVTIFDGPLAAATVLAATRYRRLRTQVALIVGANESTDQPRQAQALALQLGASAVIAGAPADRMELARFLEELSIELSHDQPLDVALRLAATATSVELPVLHCQPGFADGSRISRRAMGLFDELIATNLEARGVSFSGTPGLESSGPSLEEMRTDMRFDHESDGGNTLAQLSARRETIRGDGAVRAPPRYLTAQLGADGAKVDAVAPERAYDLAVWIGEFDPDALSLVQAIDEKFAGAEVELDVVVSEPNLLPQPVWGAIVLPPNGRSTPARFRVFTRAGVARLELRVTVLHRGRVLQGGIIRAAIDGQGALTFELDAVGRHRLAGLEHRRVFDAAFVANHAADGTEGVLGVAGNEAGYVSLDPSATKSLTEELGRAIAAIAADPSKYRKLRDVGTIKLLRGLAQRGARFYTQLKKHQQLGASLLTAERIQIVSARDETFLPIELVYENPAPDEDADLCADAEVGLEKGKCTCAPSERFVCPLAFWSLTRVIERQAHRPDHNALRAKGDFELTRSETVTPGRAALERPKAAVFAASERANDVVKTTTAEVRQMLETTFGAGNVSVAADWTQWVDGVKAARQPNILVLLPHHEEGNDTGILEIGSKQTLSALAVKQKHVAAKPPPPAPIVLLLGCATAMSRVPYESFVSIFRDCDAALVVSTIATVLGRDAGPVAQGLVQAILDVHDRGGGFFGDAMLAIRRKLLLDGKAMVLALTTYGDADWTLAARKDP